MRLTPRSVHHLNRAFHFLLLSLALLSLFLLSRSSDPNPYDRHVIVWFPLGAIFAAVAELLEERYPAWTGRCRTLAGGSALLFVAGLLLLLLAPF